MGYSINVLADSVNEHGNRLTTLEIRFPRIVLVDFNTHRVLSRNGSSSRAIPVSKKASMTLADPFIPESFCENKPGMQAGGAIEGWRATLAMAVWKALVAGSVLGAKMLAALGVHKQWANRPLEPYSWQTAIVTGTEWANFFGLRANEEAQPEFQRIAYMMSSAMSWSTPVQLKPNQWHLPLMPDLEELRLKYNEFDLARISCARCARVSYMTHDGKIDPVADLKLAKRLQSSGHMSPFEHAAYALHYPVMVGNFRGWGQYRKILRHEDNYSAFLAEKKIA